MNVECNGVLNVASNNWCTLRALVAGAACWHLLANAGELATGANSKIEVQEAIMGSRYVSKAVNNG